MSWKIAETILEILLGLCSFVVFLGASFIAKKGEYQAAAYFMALSVSLQISALGMKTRSDK